MKKREQLISLTAQNEHKLAQLEEIEGIRNTLDSWIEKLQILLDDVETTRSESPTSNMIRELVLSDGLMLLGEID